MQKEAKTAGDSYERGGGVRGGEWFFVQAGMGRVTRAHACYGGVGVGSDAVGKSGARSRPCCEFT